MSPTSDSQSANQTIHATNPPEIPELPRRSNIRIDPAKYKEIRTDQGGIRYACSLCEKSYKHRKSLNAHWRTSHTNEIPPPLSTPIPAQETGVVTRMKVNSVLKCHLCSLSLQSMPEINEHFRGNHSDQLNAMMTKPFAEIKASSMLTLHEPENVRFQCMVCEKTYKEISDLGRHFENSHGLLPNPYKKRKRAKSPVERTSEDRTKRICQHPRNDSPITIEDSTNIADGASVILLSSEETSPPQIEPTSQDVLALATRLSTNHLIELGKEFDQLVKKLSPARLVSCRYCDFQATDNSSVAEHARLCHAKFARFYCTDCGRASDCKVQLEAHIRKKHLEDGLAIIIEIPERFLFAMPPDLKTFLNTANIIALERSRPVDLPVVSTRIIVIYNDKICDEFKCPECPFETPSRSKWRTHRRLHGRRDAEGSVRLKRSIAEHEGSSKRRKVTTQSHSSESSVVEIGTRLNDETKYESNTATLESEFNALTRLIFRD